MGFVHEESLGALPVGWSKRASEQKRYWVDFQKSTAQWRLDTGPVECSLGRQNEYKCRPVQRLCATSGALGLRWGCTLEAAHNLGNRPTIRAAG